MEQSWVGILNHAMAYKGAVVEALKSARMKVDRWTIPGCIASAGHGRFQSAVELLMKSLVVDSTE